jgi:two-component system, chemotaxis family, chemotaxis protein CheY
MIDLEDELAKDYLAECSEHLSDIEADLLVVEKGGAAVDEQLVNRIFRAAHSIKGGAGYFELVKIRDLAHQLENVLALIRSRKVIPTPDTVRVLLQATDRLGELVQHAAGSNQADTSDIETALGGLLAEHRATSTNSATPSNVFATASREAPDGPRTVRMLLVEDDFASRLLLQTFLSRYGECHVAVNGREAVEAFRTAMEQGQKYDLICMDIMMPEMDGREAVRQVRALEESRGILSSSGAKIIMATAVEDVKEVSRCFKELCDAYLVKPIDLSQLLNLMKRYHLVP